MVPSCGLLACMHYILNEKVKRLKYSSILKF